MCEDDSHHKDNFGGPYTFELTRSAMTGWAFGEAGREMNDFSRETERHFVRADTIA